jgi:hypothetical protein
MEISKKATAKRYFYDFSTYIQCVLYSVYVHIYIDVHDVTRDHECTNYIINKHTEELALKEIEIT